MNLALLIINLIVCSAAFTVSASAIHDAIKNGDIATARSVLSQKELIENDITPLFLAVDQDLIDVVQLLLNDKVDVNKKMSNSKDYKGWTALHLAASKDNEVLVDLLLRAGAKKDILNAQGERPSKLASDASIKNKLE